MSEFRVTFGVRYRHEPHPVLPKADPDGYITVVADSEPQARSYLFEHIGRAWAFIYPEPFDEARWAQLHPHGEFLRLDASEWKETA